MSLKKMLSLFLFFSALSSPAYAATPTTVLYTQPFSGIPDNRITSTTVGSHTGMDVNIVSGSSSGGSGGTVSQGAPGTSPWLVSDSAAQALLNSILEALGSPLQEGGNVEVTQGTNPWVVSGNVNATQAGTWTTGRTWNLSSSTDSVSVTGAVTANPGAGTYQTNITNSSIPVTQSGPWMDTVVQPTASNLNATVVGPSGVTLGTDASLQAILTALGSPFQAGGSIGNTSFGSSQVGTWTTGRTWNLSSSTDSVSVAGTVATSNASVGVDGATAPTSSTQIGGQDSSGKLQSLQVDASKYLLVDGSQVTQPVSGTVTANAGTGTYQANITNASIPVTQSGPWSDAVVQPTASNLNATVVGPSGTALATNAELVTINSTLGTPFQAGGAISNTVFGATESGAWNVGITGTLPPFASTPTVNLGTIGGASTAANQVTEISDLGTIVTNTADTTTSVQNTQGSVAPGTAAINSDLEGGVYNSSALTLTSGQQAALQLNASGALKVDGSAVTQPVSGTVTTNPGTGVYQTNVTNSSIPVTQSGSWTDTVVQPTASLLNATVVGPSGTALATQAGQTQINTTLGSPFQAGGSIGNTSFGASQVGTWTTGRTWNLSSSTDSVTVTGTTTTTNASIGADNTTAPTSSTQIGGQDSSGKLQALQVDTSKYLLVDGSNVTQPVSGTVTANAGTGTFQTNVTNASIPVTQSGTWSDTVVQPTAANLNATVVGPSGTTLATNAELVTINTTLGSPFQVGGSIGNTSFGASEVGTWNINNITGTVSLPTGASTSANQATEISDLASIVTNTTGLATAANQTSQITQETSTATNTSNINTSVQNTQGSVAAGTAASKSNLAGGVYNSTAPTLTTGQQAALQLNTSGALKVDGSASTQPVSGTVTANAGTGTFQTNVTNASIPVTESGTWNINNISGTISLPTGASTSANQSTEISDLGTIISNTTGIATAANQTSQITQETATATNTANTNTSVQNTQGSVAAGTAALKSDLAGLQYNSTAPTLTAGQQVAAQADSAGRLLVDGSQVTQPVSGTVTANAGTGTFQTNVTNASIPVTQSGTWSDTVVQPTAANLNATVVGPSGTALATAAGLTTINTTLGSPFQAGGSIGNTVFGATESGTWNLNNITGTVSLPTGASTAANQSTEITELVTIGTNTSNTNTSVQNTQGSVAAGTAASKSDLGGLQYNSTALTMTTGQQAALQGDAAGRLLVDGSQVTQPVSGTVAISNASIPVTQSGTWSDTVTQPTAANLNATVVGPSGVALATAAGLTTINTTLGSPFQAGGSIGNTVFGATESGTWNINNISGTISLPTGASTAANQSTEISDLNSIVTNTTGIATAANQSSQITQETTIATNTANTNTSVQNTQGSVAAGTAATKSNLSGGVYNSTTPTLTTGQQAALQLNASGSLKVDGSAVTQPVSGTITANAGTGTFQTNVTNASIPVTESGTWNLNNITGTVSLPTGAATSANQTSQITQETNIANNTSTITQNQTNGTQKTQLVDSSDSTVGPVFPQQGVNYLPVTLPVDFTSSTQSITTQDTGTTTVTGYANQSLITGAATSGSVATYSLNSIQTVVVIVKGTWTGTLEYEVSEDAGITYEPRSVHVVGTNTYTTISTANMVGTLNTAGKTNFRVRAIAAMTGTASISIVESDNPSNMYIANALQLVDGSSTPATNKLTIKAGSTFSASTDTGAVVSVRPDQVGTPNQISVTCGTSSTTLLAAGSATQFVSIRNPSNSGATVWINVAGNTATTAPPSADILPGNEADFYAQGPSFLTAAQINCIGSASAAVMVLYK